MMARKYHHGDLRNALIDTGIEILAREGIGALSLRKVAQAAGVSHSAPYAHFADKQALIAAISTEGFNQLYSALDVAITARAGQPRQQLFAGARAYVDFAVQHSDTFRIMFSGVLEKEKDYPAFVEIAHQTFRRVVEVVEACQAAGVLRAGPAGMLAMAVWGQVHGIVSLSLEGQISRSVLDGQSLHAIVVYALEQLVAG